MAEGKPQTSFGSELQYTLARLLLKGHLFWLLRLVLLVAVLYYTLLPKARKRSASYLERRFPGQSRSELWLHCFRLHWQFALTLLDRLRAERDGSVPLAPLKPEQNAILKSIADSPKGCVVVSAHVGAWQTGLAGLALCQKHVNIVQRATPGDHLGGTWHYGSDRACTLLNACDQVGCLISARAALKKGEIVCFMGDRRPAATKGLALPFLQGTITLPVTPYALAEATGSSLLLLTTARVKGRAALVSLEYLPCAQRAEGLPGSSEHSAREEEALRYAAYCERFVRHLRNFVERYPYQFFNFYDLWACPAPSTENAHTQTSVSFPKSKKETKNTCQPKTRSEQ